MSERIYLARNVRRGVVGGLTLNTPQWAGAVRHELAAGYVDTDYRYDVYVTPKGRTRKSDLAELEAWARGFVAGMRFCER